MIDDVAVNYLVNTINAQVYCMSESSYDEFIQKLEKYKIISSEEYQNLYKGKYDPCKLHIFVKYDAVYMIDHFTNSPIMIYNIVPEFSIIVNGSSLRVRSSCTGSDYFSIRYDGLISNHIPNKLFLSCATTKSLGVVGEPTNIRTFGNQYVSVGDEVSVLLPDSTCINRVVCKDEQGRDFIKGLEDAYYNMPIMNGVYRRHNDLSKFVVIKITKSWKNLSCDSVISDDPSDWIFVRQCSVEQCIVDKETNNNE